MAPQLLFDISGIDLQHVELDAAAIEAINPHRDHMRQLDAVVRLLPEQDGALAYKDVRADEFWVSGHIPGRPLFPGVLMLEAAAQLASVLRTVKYRDGKFMGFTGLEDVKFRGQVAPGARLYVLAKLVDTRPRRTICAAQGLVDGNLCFEAVITGMPL